MVGIHSNRIYNNTANLLLLYLTTTPTTTAVADPNIARCRVDLQSSILETGTARTMLLQHISG